MVLQFIVSSVFSCIMQIKAGYCVQFQLTNLSLIQERTLIHHQSARSLKLGQSRISSPHHGYCDVFALWEKVLEVFGSGQSDVLEGTSMTRCCVVNANILYMILQGCQKVLKLTAES